MTSERKYLKHFELNLSDLFIYQPSSHMNHDMWSCHCVTGMCAQLGLSDYSILVMLA